jgi:Predicted transcriptional regulators
LGKACFTYGGGIVKNKVRELRQRACITQEEMAQELGVSRQTVISLEKEKYRPSIVLAFKVARLFKTSIEDVFTLEEEDITEYKQKI